VSFVVFRENHYFVCFVTYRGELHVRLKLNIENLCHRRFDLFVVLAYPRNLPSLTLTHPCSCSHTDRTDPLFGLGANVALIFSGQYVKFVSNMRASLGPGVDAWAVSLQWLMGAVIGSGGVLLMAYKYIQEKIVKQNEEMKVLKKYPAKKKAKMTMKESAKFLLSSPYIRDLATLVISYGMCINIVEVSWKARLKQAFPDPNSYSAFMGNFSSATGAVTLVMMLLGRTIFQKFGWRVAALVTPTVRGRGILSVVPNLVLALACVQLYVFSFDLCRVAELLFLFPLSTLTNDSNMPFTDDWCDWAGLFRHQPVCLHHGTGCSPDEYDPPHAECHFGGRAEHPK
jgi:TLC ATP/ADP transporter